MIEAVGRFLAWAITVIFRMPFIFGLFRTYLFVYQVLVEIHTALTERGLA